MNRTERKEIVSILREAASDYAENQPHEGCCTAINGADDRRRGFWHDDNVIDYFAAIFKQRNRVYWWANPHSSHKRFEADREARMLAMCLAADMCESGEPEYDEPI